MEHVELNEGIVQPAWPASPEKTQKKNGTCRSSWGRGQSNSFNAAWQSQVHQTKLKLQVVISFKWLKNAM